jgi:hypothetical protein
LLLLAVSNNPVAAAPSVAAAGDAALVETGAEGRVKTR